MFIAASIANYFLITEHAGVDGLISTLIGIAGRNREPPYAFNNSKNGVEDALGIIAALGVSRLKNSEVGSGVPADGLPDQGGNATACVQIARLGSGSRESLALVIPPIVSLLILAYLFGMSFREDWKVGGGVNKEAKRCPGLDKYAAESLVELMRLGQDRGASCMSERTVDKPVVSISSTDQAP